jgi:hypothetical protein
MLCFLRRILRWGGLVMRRFRGVRVGRKMREGGVGAFNL